MKLLLRMSWTLNGKGGSDKHPSWNDVYHCLKRINRGAGTITLDVLPGSSGTVERLQLIAENDYYLITLSEIIDDEYQVRTFCNPLADEKEINILGDRWPLKMLTRDFSFVIKIFKEFFDVGNVSTELLH